MPLQETSGNVTADAYGGGVAAIPNYIEDVFSTWLYTGTGATQTITNGIDLSTKGGLTWIKSRSAATNNNLFDTTQGTTKLLHSNTTDATITDENSLTAFNTTGFTLGSGNTTGNQVNTSAATYASWTFRKQPKFFDIVTWTGNDTARTISHSLGSVPGCIMVKSTNNSAYPWVVYHRSLGANKALELDSANAPITYSGYWDATSPTSTQFTVGVDGGVNASGNTYIAYIFAHDSAGFGLTGTDNVISCGSFTTDGSGNATVSLGYEPQWVLIKKSSATGDWLLQDTMRGMNQTNLVALTPNTADAENNFGAPYVVPTATGFDIINSYVGTGATAIYIAIRSGPMKVPTSGTSVFAPVTYTGNGTTRTITTNFPVSQYFLFRRDATSTGNISVFDRLRGYSQRLITSGTAAETSDATFPYLDSNTGVVLQGGVFNTSGESRGIWAFQRAPSFFDEVCYTGTGATQTITHNLTVAPELLILKSRTNATDWRVLFPAGASSNRQGYLNGNNVFGTVSATIFGNGSSYVAPTSTNFTVGSYWASGDNVVAYLFATCAGVSKVGSYTGNGSTQTINCGFTGGARFVFIKKTTGAGSWFVYDSARGMTTLTDPYLQFNSTAAEVATLGSVTTVSTGFAVNEAILNINTSSATYLFLAIA